MTVVDTSGVVAPYRGLAPFGDGELDALLFFGRERETEIATANLIASRLTVLYGPSGVGKTSLLRAGVARRVRELGARRAVGRGPDLACVVFSSWAGDPVRALADAVEAEVAPLVSPIAPRPPDGATLADVLEHWSALLDGDLCLVLDQLEEYFVYQDGGPLEDQLPEVVLRPELRANVVLSLRDDALALLDVFKPSIPNVFGNHLRLDRLDRDAARAAILGPIERWNELADPANAATIEPRLVEDVLAQSASGADAGRVEPPYLQLVMERVWNEEHERGSRVLRQATLADLGGAAAIVREHLDRALGVLDKDAQEAAARMFEHLVTPSGTKIAHRASDLAQFARIPAADAQPVLAALGHERILRPLDDVDGDRYEIFHDVLAQAILEWRRRREFEHERATTRQRLRRVAAVAIAALAALVVMTGVSVYALSQRRAARAAAGDAREQEALAHARARDAEAGERAAQAGKLAARALLAVDNDPEGALRAALRAAVLQPSRTEAVLRTVLQKNRLLASIDLGVPVSDVKYVHGGPTMLAAGSDGSLTLLDSLSGKVMRPLVLGEKGHHATLAPDGGGAAIYGRGGARVVDTDGRTHELGRGDVIAAAIPGTGHTVVQTLGPLGRERVRVSDATNGRARLTFPVRNARYAVSSRASAWILVIGGDGVVGVHDGTYGGFLYSVRHPGVTTATFDPAGRRFATGGTDGHVRLWNVGDAVPEHDLEVHGGDEGADVLDVAFSPRGTYVAAATSNGLAEAWVVRTGERASAVTEHVNFVSGVLYSADGVVLATWSRDRTARISKANTGVPVAIFGGHRDAVTSVAFDARHRRAATSSDDGRVRVWNAEAQPFLALVSKLREPLTRVEFVDGRLVVRGKSNTMYVIDKGDGRVLSKRRAGPLTARSADGAVVAIARRRAVELEHAGRRARLPAGGGIADVAVSRDGRRVAAAVGKNGIVWKVVTGKVEHVLHRHRDNVTSIAFSNDGSRVVTAGRDHSVIEWRLRDGGVMRTFQPQFGLISDAAFSPNGRSIVTAGPITAALLDADAAGPVTLLQGHEGRLTGATFDPSGDRIYTVALDGTVRTYRCEVCGGPRELEAVARARLAKFRRR